MGGFCREGVGEEKERAFKFLAVILIRVQSDRWGGKSRRKSRLPVGKKPLGKCEAKTTGSIKESGPPTKG